MRLLCAALVLFCASLRAANGFPEVAGFFTETSAGIYQARGARLAVTAGSSGVSFGGVPLRHLRARSAKPAGVDPMPAIILPILGPDTQPRRLSALLNIATYIPASPCAFPSTVEQ